LLNRTFGPEPLSPSIGEFLERVARRLGMRGELDAELLRAHQLMDEGQYFRFEAANARGLVDAELLMRLARQRPSA